MATTPGALVLHLNTEQLDELKNEFGRINEQIDLGRKDLEELRKAIQDLDARLAAVEGNPLTVTPLTPHSPTEIPFTDEMWRAGYKAFKETKERGEDDKIVAHQVIKAALWAAPQPPDSDPTHDHLLRQDQALVAIAEYLSAHTANNVRDALGVLATMPPTSRRPNPAFVDAVGQGLINAGYAVNRTTLAQVITAAQSATE